MKNKNAGIIIESYEIEKFRKYLFENERADATISKYLNAITAIKEKYHGEELNREKLILYRRKLLETHKAQTVNGIFTALNAFSEFLARPDMRIRLIRVQNRAFIDENKELNEDEYKRLLNAARESGNERLYMILMTLCSTGIRVSELKFITVEAIKRRSAEIYLKGKTRSVLLPQKLCSKLWEYSKRKRITSGEVFITRNGKSIDRSNICHAMKKLCPIAGIDDKKVFPHNLRHLFARMFYSVEKNIAHLADVLGHSRIETTRIYLAVSTSAHERTLNKMKLII